MIATYGKKGIMGMSAEKLFYREMTKEDFLMWDKLSRADFLSEDFCSADFFLEKGDRAKGWVLLNQDNKWIGCCFITFDLFEYNQNGVHFREYWVAPKYRNKGYAKYLIKIWFDATKGLCKSGCVNPSNFPSINVIKKNGFVKNGTYKIWDMYVCDKNYYPEHVRTLELCNLDTEN